MATSVFQILIKLAREGNADKETISSLYKLKASMTNALGVFGAVTAAAYTVGKAYSEVAEKFTGYADSVRSVMNATGLESEEASRLLQVTEDLGVSHESLTKSMLQLAKHGIDPTISNLAMLSDQYRVLAPGVDQVRFLTDNFGKSGADLARVMAAGSDAILEMADSVNKGLVVTEDMLRMAEQNTLAIGNLNDAWDEFQIMLGVKAVPQVTRMIEMTTDLATALIDEDGKLRSLGKTFYEFGTLRVAAAKEASIEAANALRDHGEALMGVIEPTIALDTSTEELADEMGILKAAMSGDLQQAYDDYVSKMGELKTEHTELTESLQELLDYGYSPTSEKVQILTDQLAANEQKQKDVAKATELATSKMIFQQVASKLDVKSQLELARTLGLISERDYAVATALDTLTQKYDENKDGVVDASEGAQELITKVQALKDKIENLPDEQVIDIITNYYTNGTPPYIPPVNPPSCFLAGTMIATPAGERAIETIQPGEEVISFDDTHGEIVTTVAKVFHHTGRDAAASHFLINQRLRVTGNHPIRAGGEWREVRDIELGHILTTRGGGFERVNSKKFVIEYTATYNLEIDHPCHNYYAEGILAHNKIIENPDALPGGYTPAGAFTGDRNPFSDAGSALPLSGGAVPVTITGGLGGLGSGTTIYVQNVTISSGANMGEFLQALMDASGR